MSGRIFALLAAIAMIWCALPPEPCLCNTLTPAAVPARTTAHSCCEQAKQHEDLCDSGHSLTKKRNCCGASSSEIPALVSGLKVLKANALFIHFVSFASINNLIYERALLACATAPRAPPYVPGLGSSKTYLYKRSLLI